MFSRLLSMFKRRSVDANALDETVSNSEDKCWAEIEKFDKWVETQPDTVIHDLLCRLSLRLLPTVCVDGVGLPITDNSPFHDALDASIDILACRIDHSCGRRSNVRALDGGNFYHLPKGVNNEYSGITWHAIESTADSLGYNFHKKYICEVNRNIHRKFPDDHNRFFEAVIADCSVWEAWAKSGADKNIRARNMMSPLWDGSTPAESFIKGIRNIIKYLELKREYQHLLILSVLNKR